MAAGAPKGNKNGINKGQFKDALRKALASRHGGVSDGLVAVANRLLDAAHEGESWAIQEIANRFDGKPRQETIISGDDEGGPVKTQAQIIFIPAKMEND